MVNMRIIKFVAIILLFFSSYSYGENRLGPKNLKALIDLGYSKKDAYADDYSKSKAYWFELEEHLQVKPKYLALLSQKMKINGKETINHHIYNSKHHFFGDKKSKCVGKKGLAVGPLNLKKCQFLKPKVIDDTQLMKSTFANMALDHCNETKVKNLKTESGKILKITDTKKCSIKFINFSKYEFTKVLKKVGKNENKPNKQKNKPMKSVDLEKFKKQCKDLGFKPKTEKFGECVLRLLEAMN
mgnify:CR=1 FL=1|tara:strand:+ start:93 stop:818 length:726 start_codon:yes stop_codon:yes gene_type:complete